MILIYLSSILMVISMILTIQLLINQYIEWYFWADEEVNSNENEKDVHDTGNREFL